jgi:hypothetical protein
MNSRNSDFEDYILSNKSTLRNRFISKENVVKSSLDGDKLEIKVSINKYVLDSWSTIINTYFEDINLSKDFKDKICLYCEVLKLYNEKPMTINTNYMLNSSIKTYIPEELSKIRESILEKKIRSKIIDKYYNYTNGKVEYLLENGEYIEIKEPVVRPITNLDMSVLPIGLLSIIDDNEYRNKKIDQIL